MPRPTKRVEVDLPVRPELNTQSRTRLMIGTLPTGIKALDKTFVPSLKGYKLTRKSVPRLLLPKESSPLAVADGDDDHKVLRVDHPPGLGHVGRVVYPGRHREWEG